jgi:hypothetical protein
VLQKGNSDKICVVKTSTESRGLVGERMNRNVYWKPKETDHFGDLMLDGRMGFLKSFELN